MGRISKIFALFLTLTVFMSCLTLLTVNPVNAMPTPFGGYYYHLNGEKVALNPSSGPPNTYVEVNCSGFYPESYATVLIRNGSDNFVLGLPIIGQKNVDDYGNVAFKVIIPDLPFGTYRFIVQDYSPRSQGEAQLTITSLTPPPTPSPTPTVPTPTHHSGLPPQNPTLLIIVVTLMVIALVISLLLFRRHREPASLVL